METVVKHEINPLLDGIMPGEIMKLDGKCFFRASEIM
jgi:hypothetical protein